MITDTSITYTAEITDVEDCHLIHFPDLPEARTFVRLDERDKAGEVALDCLRTALDSRVRDGEAFPQPRFQAAGLDVRHRLICTVGLRRKYKNHPIEKA